MKMKLFISNANIFKNLNNKHCTHFFSEIIIMSCCDLSVLDYLRKAAVKLEINQDYGAPDIYGLDEFEITSIIYQYYQVIISYTSV